MKKPLKMLSILMVLFMIVVSNAGCRHRVEEPEEIQEPEQVETYWIIGNISSASPNPARAGELVTITINFVAPPECYVHLEIKDSNYDSVSFNTIEEDRRYSFTMPASYVTVHAESCSRNPD